MLHRYNGDASREAAVLGRFLHAMGRSASVVALLGCFRLLGATYMDFVGIGYQENLAEYAVFCFFAFEVPRNVIRLSLSVWTLSQ